MKENKVRILRFVAFAMVGFIVSFLFVNAASAARIEMGTEYALEGEIEWFDAIGHSQSAVVQPGTTFQFHDNGIFSLAVELDGIGSIALELGYDVADFNAGGDVFLRSSYESRADAIIDHINATGGAYAREFDTNMDGHVVSMDALYHINDINAGVTSAMFKQVGLFDTQHLSLPDFVFIATKEDAVFNLDSFSLLLGNGQFSPGGELLGEAEWRLSAVVDGGGDAEVPEPASMLLLAAGLLGGLVKRTHK